MCAACAQDTLCRFTPYQLSYPTPPPIHSPLTRYVFLKHPPPTRHTPATRRLALRGHTLPHDLLWVLHRNVSARACVRECVYACGAGVLCHLVASTLLYPCTISQLLFVSQVVVASPSNKQSTCFVSFCDSGTCTRLPMTVTTHSLWVQTQSTGCPSSSWYS
jgi:hypothetical protein